MHGSQQSLIKEIDFWAEMIEREKGLQKPHIIERMKLVKALAENRLIEYETLAFCSM